MVRLVPLGSWAEHVPQVAVYEVDLEFPEGRLRARVFGVDGKPARRALVRRGR